RVKPGNDVRDQRQWRSVLTVQRFERGEQLVRRGGGIADADAGRGIDSVDDRRARPANAGLAEALAAEGAAVRVGLLEKHGVERADIGIHRDVVARQVLVESKTRAARGIY